MYVYVYAYMCKQYRSSRVRVSTLKQKSGISVIIIIIIIIVVIVVIVVIVIIVAIVVIMVIVVKVIVAQKALLSFVVACFDAEATIRSILFLLRKPQSRDNSLMHFAYYLLSFAVAYFDAEAAIRCIFAGSMMVCSIL